MAKPVDYTIPVELVEADIPGETPIGLAIQGKFDLDSTKHNITYHSQTFDDKLDWFIKDEVEVGFSVIGVPTTMQIHPFEDQTKKARMAGLFCVLKTSP